MHLFFFFFFESPVLLALHGTEARAAEAVGGTSRQVPYV